MITDLSVVEDPVRTRGAGPWTFRHLAEALAPTAAEAPALVEAWLSQWLSDQVVNGHVVPARPALRRLVLDPWPRIDGGLDLSRAPFRLLAIVNRMDLRDLAAGNAGEGRFVFGVLDARGAPTEFTVILEYKLPAATAAEVRGWADAWHALGALPFPSAAYNEALEAITTRFAGRNAAPGRPNGSALSQLRTNEIALAAPWELREFALDTATGRLQPKVVELTPDASFDRTAALAGFVNANETAILAGTHLVPNGLGGAPFAGGASRNDLAPWRAPGVLSNDARHLFSLGTCNGCHGVETGTPFLHVFPRPAGRPSALSAFLTGTALPDPVNRQVTRSFADLGRRSADLRSIVCAATPTGTSTSTSTSAAAPPSGVAPSVRALTLPEPAGARPSSLTKGLDRVH
jgi:hypothetical protein